MVEGGGKVWGTWHKQTIKPSKPDPCHVTGACTGASHNHPCTHIHAISPGKIHNFIRATRLGNDIKPWQRNHDDVAEVTVARLYCRLQHPGDEYVSGTAKRQNDHTPAWAALCT